MYFLIFNIIIIFSTSQLKTSCTSFWLYPYSVLFLFCFSLSIGQLYMFRHSFILLTVVSKQQMMLINCIYSYTYLASSCAEEHVQDDLPVHEVVTCRSISKLFVCTVIYCYLYTCFIQSCEHLYKKERNAWTASNQKFFWLNHTVNKEGMLCGCVVWTVCSSNLACIHNCHYNYTATNAYIGQPKTP